MTAYRKKPIVIEAVQWFEMGDHPEVKEVPDLFLSSLPEPFCIYGWVDTLEGGHVVSPGDYIIKGVVGEYYPCKPDIFEMSYEKVLP